MTSSESKGRFFVTKRIDSHKESNRFESRIGMLYDGEPMLLMTETKNEISTSTNGAVCLRVLTGYQRAQVLN